MPTRWTLADLIDLEALLARGAARHAHLDPAEAGAPAGQPSVGARRQAIHAWLAAQRSAGGQLPGQRWVAAAQLVTLALSLLLFASGVSVVLALFDRERGGFNIPVFVGVTLGVQWLVLLGAALAWLLRRRLGAGLLLVPSLVNELIDRVCGERRPAWWRNLTAEGGRYASVLIWQLARMVQTAACAYNLGLLAGLAGCLWFLNVGFFWESTTPVWMQQRLTNLTSILAAPWRWAAPAWCPSEEAISATRIGSDSLPNILGRADAWYPFLLAALAVWGLLPRVLLWLTAWRGVARTLGTLDFQARRHRELWRNLTGSRRSDLAGPPLDGVVVLDVGGSGLREDALRPFFLRRLRVRPACWLPVAVLDAGSEALAAEALASAPAGVVLLAEGWALSPPRMRALHQRVRAAAGAAAPVVFLVANADPDGKPAPPAREEAAEWARFVDQLGDPSAELELFAEAPAG